MKIKRDPYYFALSNIAGLEMDIRDLRFENESFDVAIDKGADHPTYCSQV